MESFWDLLFSQPDEESSLPEGAILPFDLRDGCPKCKKGILDVGIKGMDESGLHLVFINQCDNPDCGYTFLS